jgi:hypothetical protein
MKLTCLSMLCACAVAGAAPVTFQSPERQVSLLELYTSEGCSSCPPAEAWLSRLTNQPGLWTDFVPIAFHISYWNNLGWRDKFSSDEFSQRQNDYAREWSAQDIYTPEFVLNGREWHDWFGFRSAPSASPTKVGTLQVSSTDGKHWEASFIPVENGPADYDVTAALLACNVASDVTAGENSGRHLDHDFAALSLITRSLVRQTNDFHGTFITDPDPKGVTGRLALAVWVTRSGQLEPLQATGGWLPLNIISSTNQPTQK